MPHRPPGQLIPRTSHRHSHLGSNGMMAKLGEGDAAWTAADRAAFAAEAQTTRSR